MSDLRIATSLRQAINFNVKPPARLPFVAAEVAPEWGWFWNGLVGCWPMWQKSQSMVNIVFLEDVAVSQGSWSDIGWQTTEVGWGMHAADGGDSWIVNNTSNLTGLTNGTWLSAVRNDGLDGNAGLLGSINGENSAIEGQMFYDAVGGSGGLRLASKLQINSIIDERVFETPATAENLNILSYSYDGVQERLKINKEEQTFAKTGALHSNTELGLALGANSSVSTSRLLHVLFYVAVWNYAVPSSRLDQLAADPFGPFRTERRSYLPVAKPALPAQTVLRSRLSRR